MMMMILCPSCGLFTARFISIAIFPEFILLPL